MGALMATLGVDGALRTWLITAKGVEHAPVPDEPFTIVTMLTRKPENQPA
jgi:hypothetical protein